MLQGQTEVYIVVVIFRGCMAKQKYILWWLYLGVAWPNRTCHKQAKPSSHDTVNFMAFQHSSIFLRNGNTKKNVKTSFCTTANILCYS